MLRRATFVIAALAASPALAQAPPAPAPEPQLSPAEQQEIERALGADAKAAAQAAPPPAAPSALSTGAAALQSLLPDISFITDVAFAWFSAKDPLQTGGHDPTKNGFALQQLEMALGKSVDPYFRLDGNIVFSQFGVEIEEIYATTLALPANLQLRVGQFLTRFGRINNTHPHTWDFVDQNFPIGRIFGSEGNRGLGVELSWLTPLPWYVEVIGSASDASGEGTARSFLGGGSDQVENLLDFQLTLAIKQFFPLSDDLSLNFGLSVANGPNATGHRNRTDVYGTDVYLKYRPITRESTTQLTLQAELFYRRRQIPDDVLSDVSAYAQTVWRFAARWTTGARWEWGSPAKDQDGNVAEDPLDPEWNAARHRLTANVTFFPTEFSRIRVQGSVDLVPWRDDASDRIWAFMTSFEFNVGVHGAHKF